MKILFTGDVNFRGLSLTPDRAEEILAPLRPTLNAADFIVPNLECPLADSARYAPIPKSGPNLCCAPENICFLQKMGASAVTLANNHIGDLGGGALTDTLALLDDAGILHAGAGRDIGEAYRAFRLEKDGCSLSVLSVCEHEFGLADADKAGSAAYDPRRLLRRIREEKERSRFVAVVFHGGNEFDPLPSPDTVERHRLVCDMGADCVVGGHTHCPQGMEMYGGKPIVYSMGNLFFPSGTPRDPSDPWYYGYMTLLTLGDTVTAEPVLTRFSTDPSRIVCFDGAERAAMLRYLAEISAPIGDERLLGSYFRGWTYLHQWCPKPVAGGYGHWNLVYCEAHHSQLKTLMEMYAEDTLEDAREWADRITALSRMPV